MSAADATLNESLSWISASNVIGESSAIKIPKLLVDPQLKKLKVLLVN